MKILRVLAVLLLAVGASAQTKVIGGGGGSSPLTANTSATSGCTDGGFLYSLTSLLRCGSVLVFTDAATDTLKFQGNVGVELFYTNSSIAGIRAGNNQTYLRLGMGSSGLVVNDQAMSANYALWNSTGLRVGDATAPAAALEVTNGAAAKGIMTLFDNTTPVLTVADGGATTFTQPVTVPDTGGAAVAGLKWTTAGAGLSWVNGLYVHTATSYPIYMNQAKLGVGRDTSILWSNSATDGANGESLILGREASATLQLGADINGAATPQAIKAHDGITGTDISGANLTIAAGRGTGAGTGGTLIFQTAPVGSTGTTAQTLATVLTLPKSGGLQVATGTKPTCEAATRGTLYYVAGGAGVADTYEACRKDAGDAYAWVAIY